MSKKGFRIPLIIAAVIGTLGVSSIAMARGPMGHGPGHMLHELVEALDLNEEQQVIASALKDEVKADREAQRETREAAFDTAMEELAKPQPNVKALHGLIDDGVAALGESLHQRLDGFLELHATFDETQRATLVEELEAGRAKRQERMDMHRQRMEEGGPRR